MCHSIIHDCTPHHFFRFVNDDIIYHNGRANNSQKALLPHKNTARRKANKEQTRRALKFLIRLTVVLTSSGLVLMSVVGSSRTYSTSSDSFKYLKRKLSPLRIAMRSPWYRLWYSYSYIYGLLFCNQMANRVSYAMR